MKTLTAYLDLAVVPVSFDVVPFLIRARMQSDAWCADHVHVVIVPHEQGVVGMFRDKLHLYDAAEMRWRLWNLVLPACHLAGCSVTLATDWEQARRLVTPLVWPENWGGQRLEDRPYYVGPIVDAARNGNPVPALSASAAALRAVRGRFERLRLPVATFTLRDTYEPGRNSDRGVWTAAMRRAEEMGFAVVVIDDTAKALEYGVGQAEVNLDIRMAMYQLAAVNVIGNAGPAQLLWFSRASFIELGAAMPFPHWSDFWRKHHRIDPARREQLPWATERQRFIYEAPSVELIERELQAFV